MKDIETVVSDNIQKLLKEYNLSHADLAKIADVSVSTVGKWVLKKAAPRMGAIQKISDHFNLPKSYILKEEVYKLPYQQSEYDYYETSISAGLPFEIDGVTDYETMTIPDELMGKYAGHKDIIISKINGDSMDKLMNDGSFIAIKPVDSAESLNNGDIVVFSHNHEYSVKYFYKHDDMLVFKPYSNNPVHYDQSFSVHDGVVIHGKVVTYIVNLD